MDKNTTSSTCASDIPQEKKTVSNEHVSPSEKTLNFLKLFARNYRASSLMPESIQGFVLG